MPINLLLLATLQFTSSKFKNLFKAHAQHISWIINYLWGQWFSTSDTPASAACSLLNRRQGCSSSTIRSSRAAIWILVSVYVMLRTSRLFLSPYWSIPCPTTPSWMDTGALGMFSNALVAIWPPTYLIDHVACFLGWLCVPAALLSCHHPSQKREGRATNDYSFLWLHCSSFEGVGSVVVTCLLTPGPVVCCYELNFSKGQSFTMCSTSLHS